MERKTQKIDFGSKRLARQADKYYNEGKYLPALRFAYKQYELYGGDGDVFTRLADIYEGLGLHYSAINWLYRFLDIADEVDLPDIYESLAINYLHLGKEAESAYYYNRLMDVDDEIPEETKMEIINAFSKDKRSRFRFVYPPKLADYSKEIDLGSKALKAGKSQTANKILSAVEKGSKSYAEAMEMRAVACLLSGELTQAEEICLELLQDEPNATRIRATLAAVYLEQGRKDESKKIALELYAEKQEDTDDLYKVATVCCENGLHEEAYEKFVLLSTKIPYDGRMLYFKGVAAYKCGKLNEAEQTLSLLCDLYPDAEVAKYYLKELRMREEEEGQFPFYEPTYFYHLPEEEREARCKSLLHIGKCPKDEAQLFALIALHDGYFRWCFDEMDGEDHDLQYLALVTAVHVYADAFIKEVMLDPEVIDALKIETLRLLYTRNEDMEIGMVLCNMHRKIQLRKIRLGRKKRKAFLDGYASFASRFIVVNPAYGKIMQGVAQDAYKVLEEREKLELIKDSNDIVCVLYMLSNFKEFGRELDAVCGVFEGNKERVEAIIHAITDNKE